MSACLYYCARTRVPKNFDWPNENDKDRLNNCFELVWKYTVDDRLWGTFQPVIQLLMMPYIYTIHTFKARLGIHTFVRTYVECYSMRVTGAHHAYVTRVSRINISPFVSARDTAKRIAYARFTCCKLLPLCETNAYSQFQMDDEEQQARIHASTRLRVCPWNMYTFVFLMSASIGYFLLADSYCQL